MKSVKFTYKDSAFNKREMILAIDSIKGIDYQNNSIITAWGQYYNFVDEESIRKIEKLFKLT